MATSSSISFLTQYLRTGVAPSSCLASASPSPPPLCPPSSELIELELSLRSLAATSFSSSCSVSSSSSTAEASALLQRLNELSDTTKTEPNDLLDLDSPSPSPCFSPSPPRNQQHKDKDDDLFHRMFILNKFLFYYLYV
jgi:hypothetical protein